MFSNLHWVVSLLYKMKHIVTIFILLFFALFISSTLQAQCAVCTKTAMQLGEKPAQGLNSGILYLMMTPFAIVGFIGYRWWRGNKKFEEEQ
jgi:hypothetical protein